MAHLEPQGSRLSAGLFLLPATLLFALYVLLPTVQSLALSLYDWNGLDPEFRFVGLQNYEALWRDPVFWISLKNNLLWLGLFLLAPPLGLALALLLNTQAPGMRLIKSLFFLPFVLSPIVVGLAFTWLYDPHFGVLNAFLQAAGLNTRFAPLADETWASFFIVLAGLWPQIAYCMIAYLAGLAQLRPSGLESAELDGVGPLTKLWKVLLPELSTATQLAFLVSIVGALRSFDLVAIMTQGGPYDRSSVLSFFMFEQAITHYRMGYAAAIASLLFALLLIVIALFLRRLLRRDDLALG